MVRGRDPCDRCIVPQRDPDIGESTKAFRERFVEKCEAMFPDWADEAVFDHYYTTTVITRVPEEDRGGGRIEEVGDT